MNKPVPHDFTMSHLEALAEKILHEAAIQGADQSEINIGFDKGFSVSAQGGDVETVEYNQDRVIDITVYIGKRSGSASFSDVRDEAIQAAVKAACHIARFTGEDPFSGLAERSELAFHYPTLQLSYPWAITVEEAIQLTVQCEQEALSQDKHIMSAEEVRLATSEANYVYANSLGFIGGYPSTRHEISCVLVAKKKTEMQRDYSYTVAADPALLQSTAFIAKEAAKKAVQRLGARRLSTMQVPVIFIAEEARGLLGHFAAAIQGGNLYRRSSFLLDHLQKKIFPSFVNIIEQPHLLHALGSAPFDGDGVLTRENSFIKQGILEQYSLGVYSAKKLGLKTTGNAGGVHNLTINPGEKNLAELLKTMDKGLLITELMGNGANLVTGDYSRGAGGYWIENGEIQYPVQEITVAGNLADMFSHIVEIGNDVDVRGNVRTGSILIDSMMIAGE